MEFSTAKQLLWTQLEDEDYDPYVVEDIHANTTSCIFQGTQSVYVDCCTGSSYNTCNYLTVMFFASLVGYASIFGYIVSKNPWIKRHGMYLYNFTFQMLVLLIRGIYYSYFGRTKNGSLNTYMAFRTAPLIFSIQSFTSYTLHLILMKYRYGSALTEQEQKKFQVKMHLVFWGIFICYIGIWLMVWRVSVDHEAIAAMDGILTGFYGVYMVIQIQLVRMLYGVLKNKLPAIAKHASCHMFLMKMIVFLHLSLRIVFNSLSDSGSKVQATLDQQISWFYILLGDGITEIFSAFGMILLMTITFQFEDMAKKCQAQYQNYSNMNAEDPSEMADLNRGPAQAISPAYASGANQNWNYQQQQQQQQQNNYNYPLQNYESNNWNNQQAAQPPKNQEFGWKAPPQPKKGIQ